MGMSPTKSKKIEFKDTASPLLEKANLYFEYNKTINEARADVQKMCTK